MSSSLSAGLAKPLVALAAVFALFLGVQVASASAASIEISPESVKTEDLKASGSEWVVIGGSGFGAYEENEGVRVGLCTEANIGIPAVAPGCGLIDETFFIVGGSLFGAVNLQPVADATAEFANEHFGQIPGQPETFDCVEQQESGSTCEIVVVEHQEKGTAIIASADITFE